MSLIRGLILFCMISVSGPVYANLFDVASGNWVSMDEVASKVKPGTIVLLGENHSSPGFNKDQKNQVQFLKSLAGYHQPISVGMEFINYTKQSVLDDYLSGAINEPEFLSGIGWGSNPYADYREQVLSSLNTGGWTWALNAPRSLTGRIAKVGLSGLSADEASLLPPDFEVGSDTYKQRFYEIMGMSAAHPMPSLEKVFVAQSAWDDTMAWKAIEHMQRRPDMILVIIVGNFHVRYGGGLEDRLKARGFNEVVSIVQVDSLELEKSEVEALAEPHAQYSLISDYLW